MKKNKMGCQNGEWGEEAGIDTKNATAVVCNGEATGNNRRVYNDTMSRG